MAKSDVKTQELERQLADRVTKNVLQIQQKFGECAVGKVEKSGSEPPSTTVDRRVRKLLQQATDSENLCMMPPSFHPWL